MRYTSKQLKKTALYDIWVDMLKRARKEWFWKSRLGVEAPFMVSSEFRDFDKFALWARLVENYSIENDSRKVVARIDPNKPFGIDNSSLVEEYAESFSFTTPKTARVKNEKPMTRSRHGLSGTRLYEIWKGMRRRCKDPKQKDYPAYGGRGISVCKQWDESLDEFMDWAWEHGYSVDLTLDRIDVNGNYCPENCRWATSLEQKLNTQIESKTYVNVRMKAGRLARFISTFDPDCVITAIVRRDKIPGTQIPKQDDFSAVPIDERIDTKRSK